jgi:hypothetical protein
VAEQLKRYSDRFNTDVTNREVQKSTLDISDAAALRAAGMKGALARGGTLGTGVGATLTSNVLNSAQRQAADAAVKLRADREHALDQLVVGGTALAALPQQQQMEAQRLALSQQGQTFGQANTVAQQEQQAALEQQKMLMQLYAPYLTGSAGAGAPYVPPPYFNG